VDRSEGDWNKFKNMANLLSSATVIFACLLPLTKAQGCDILVQQNLDGSTFFDRTWVEYKNGFGTPCGNYWIGNEQLHLLTTTYNYTMKFDLQSSSNNLWYTAMYSKFIVGDEASGYQLQAGGFSGTVLDDALINGGDNGMKFSTKDRDSDTWGGNCAASEFGGFWYSNCGSLVVNGKYGGGDGDALGWWGLTSNSWNHITRSRMWLVCASNCSSTKQ
jgi:hypothetical protein